MPLEDAWRRVAQIAKEEDMIITDDVIKETVLISDGDMRKVLNLL